MKKLIVVEAGLIASIFVLLLLLVDFMPYLNSSRQYAEIGLYAEKEYAAGNMTIVLGEREYVQFSYSSFEPVILIFELTFQSWQSTGYLNIRCNNRAIRSIFASPENPKIILTVVSTSGVEWIKSKSSMFGLNEIIFESNLENGFEGRLSYKIKLRGSR